MLVETHLAELKNLIHTIVKTFTADHRKVTRIVAMTPTVDRRKVTPTAGKTRTADRRKVTRTAGKTRTVDHRKLTHTLATICTVDRRSPVAMIYHGHNRRRPTTDGIGMIPMHGVTRRMSARRLHLVQGIVFTCCYCDLAVTFLCITHFATEK